MSLDAALLKLEHIDPKRVVVRGPVEVARAERHLREEFARLLGRDNLEMLDRYFRAALRFDVRPLLTAKPPELLSVFARRFPAFAYRSFSLSLAVTFAVLVEPSKIEQVKLLEEKSYAWLSRELREAGCPERVIRGVAALTDYDIWLLSKLAKYDFRELAAKLATRALREATEATVCRYALMYLALAVMSVYLDVVKRYEEESVRVLEGWLSNYAERLDFQIDVLDALVEDEIYEALKESGALVE